MCYFNHAGSVNACYKQTDSAYLLCFEMDKIQKRLSYWPACHFVTVSGRSVESHTNS